MIDPNHRDLSIHVQCALVDLSYSSYYYHPTPISPETERLMRRLDQMYTEHPSEGKVKRALQLCDETGLRIGVQRVRTLMAKMGLETLYPKPDTSAPNKAHEVYPYLLRDIDITYPNQVWAADITYLPLGKKHAYLFAIIDWYSRYVVAWCVAPTLEAHYCVDTLLEALKHNRCEICNTDQGSQFTSHQWIDALTEHKISISMDGRGRYLDNIFVERLWRSVKQECIYRREFESIDKIQLALEKYFDYYNNHRKHQGLGYQTPAEVYFQE